MNTLLRIAFVGTAYHGFQVQPNALTVCEVLQNAMEAVFAARPDVKGCSRTDAGVHARDFCLSFMHETAIPPEKLPLALNSHLPQDIRVQSARRVPEDFHARYSASGKRYRYVILNAAADDPFTQGFYYRVPGELDPAAMDAAARLFVGRQDFAAFQSAGGAHRARPSQGEGLPGASRAAPRRVSNGPEGAATGDTITDTTRTVTEAGMAREGDRLTFTVAADGFLYNMVRIMAGTLLAVGRGALAPEAVPGIIQSRERRRAGDTLPACGLFLDRVFYPQDALGTDPADH